MAHCYCNQLPITIPTLQILNRRLFLTFLLFRWIDELALLKSPPICYDQQLNLRGICKFFNLFTKLINASK